MKAAVVTGCFGFIGGHVTLALLREGWRVFGIDDLSGVQGGDYLEKLQQELRHFPTFQFTSETLSPAHPFPQLPTGSFDLLLHLAASSGVRTSVQFPQQYMDNNLGSTQAALDIADRLDIPRFIFASSSSVYGGRGPFPSRESQADLHPQSPYAVSKRSCEELCAEANRGKRANISLRLFSVYGPRQRPDLVLPQLVRAIGEDRPFKLFGNGAQKRDFTYIYDVVEGIFAAIAYAEAAGMVSEVFNIGRGQAVSVNQLIHEIEQVTGKKLQIAPAEKLSYEPQMTWADVTKSREVLGFQAKRNLAQGVKAYLEWCEISQN